MNRTTLLDQLFETFNLSDQARSIISGLAWEISAAELQDFLVRNEYIPDPDADEDGNYSDDEDETEEDEAEEAPTGLEFEVGDWAEYFDGTDWVAVEILETDVDDRQFPYRVKITYDPANWTEVWATTANVRREQNGND